MQREDEEQAEPEKKEEREPEGNEEGILFLALGQVFLPEQFAVHFNESNTRIKIHSRVTTKVPCYALIRVMILHVLYQVSPVHAFSASVTTTC